MADSTYFWGFFRYFFVSLLFGPWSVGFSLFVAGARFGEVGVIFQCPYCDRRSIPSPSFPGTTCVYFLSPMCVFFVPIIYSISCSAAYPEFLSTLEAAPIGSYEDMWVYPNFVPEIGSM